MWMSFFFFSSSSEKKVKTADLTKVSRSTKLFPALYEAGAEMCRGGTENPRHNFLCAFGAYARHLLVILTPGLRSGIISIVQVKELRLNKIKQPAHSR